MRLYSVRCFVHAEPGILKLIRSSQSSVTYSAGKYEFKKSKYLWLLRKRIVFHNADMNCSGIENVDS